MNKSSTFLTTTCYFFYLCFFNIKPFIFRSLKKNWVKYLDFTISLLFLKIFLDFPSN